MSDSSPSASPEEPGPEPGAPDPLVGSVIADRYRIDELLGVGGMGAVYRAEHVLMRKPVAVKVLHREMTFQEEVVKRFEREAIAAGRIDHPNVTVATDFGKLETGAFYLVLEYVPGRSLTELLKEGPLPLARALFIARQVAAGLGAAHAAGIVHRDLKPDNVMLIERGSTKDFVKVLDFGIAKVTADGTGAALTRVGSVFGTPAYMAPEQAAGQSVDHRADLYALGLVLYEMLAGKSAFESDDVMALLMKQLTEPPPPLPDFVDRAAAALVFNLVEKDPNARVQSAEELVLAIDRLLGPLEPPKESSLLALPTARSVSGAAIATAPTFAGDLPLPPGVEDAAIAEAAPSRSPSSTQGASVVARTLGGDTLRIGGRHVPLWLFGGAVGGVVMIVVLLLGMPHGGGSVPAPHATPPPPELGPIIRRAEAGDKAAVGELEARPVKGRTAAEWMAIGKGHAVALDFTPIPAFAHATRLDPSLASDPVMLRAVRHAADVDETLRPALELAAHSLGEGGADVLFDVWASTNDKTDATVLAKTLLDKDEVLAHASPSLRVALELRRATKCEDVKRLLPDAKDHADERAMRRLTQLSSRHGCGFLGLADCFPCIRQNDDLADALRAAPTRAAPHF